MGTRVAEIWQQVEDALPPQSDFTRVFEVLEKRTGS
jgi:3-hydroxyisobutyrate dehydrogenase